ncbi:MAG: transcription termination/antitermination protein NusG [Methylocella sp.]
MQTLSGREISAAAQLNAQGFRPFLPLLLKSVRHARKFRVVRAPLFPNYLFVALDLQRHRWRSVNGTFGVVRLLMIGEFPALVPAGIVETLMAQSDFSGLIHFDKGLKPGQKVKILSGPFADMIGELARIDGAGRVKLLLDVMGGKIPIMTTAALLSPAA